MKVTRDNRNIIINFGVGPKLPNSDFTMDDVTEIKIRVDYVLKEGGAALSHGIVLDNIIIMPVLFEALEKKFGPQS